MASKSVGSMSSKATRERRAWSFILLENILSVANMHRPQNNILLNAQLIYLFCNWTNEFASQTALQFYDILMTNHALRSIPTSENSMEAWSNTYQQRTLTDGDDVSFESKGKYTLQITNHVLQLMTNGNDIEVVWQSDKKKRKSKTTNVYHETSRRTWLSCTYY